MQKIDLNKLKQAAAQAALDFIQESGVIGMGTGSTVNYFIEALVAKKHLVEGVVSSSNKTTELLKKHGFPVIELTSVDSLPLYFDGADEINHHLQMIKGGGGALTREKIIGTVAKKFICMADQTKFVDLLGDFPLPIEVIPIARSYVGREIVKLDGSPVYRQGFITDNHGIILDIHNLNIMEPIKMEERLNEITGVICHGLFAKRCADVLVLGKTSGVEIIYL